MQHDTLTTGEGWTERHPRPTQPAARGAVAQSPKPRMLKLYFNRTVETFDEELGSNASVGSGLIDHDDTRVTLVGRLDK